MTLKIVYNWVRKDKSEFNARLSASLIVGKKGPLQFVAAVAEPLLPLTINSVNSIIKDKKLKWNNDKG